MRKLTIASGKLCPHRVTRPAGVAHTACVECGSRFAVVTMADAYASLRKMGG